MSINVLQDEFKCELTLDDHPIQKTPVTEIYKVARNLKIEIIMATCY